MLCPAGRGGALALPESCRATKPSHIVHRYVAELRRLLTPEGRVLLVPTCGADILALLSTGEVLPDPRAAGAATSGRAAVRWKARSCKKQLY